MRKGEIVTLTWDKVDLKNRIIRLGAEDTKDTEPRKIPVCDQIYEILRCIPKSIHNNHVFLYNGKPVRDIRTALKRACKEVSIPYGRFVKNGFVFHDLRHCFNTYMRKAGVAESVIMKITGHSTREMFDRYNTVDEDDIKGAVDQMQVFLKSVDQVKEEDLTWQYGDMQPFDFIGAEEGTRTPTGVRLLDPESTSKGKPSKKE